MAKRRRTLLDLYTKGEEVVFNDDSDDDPVVVWVQKLSPAEHEQAAKRASAERARSRARYADHDSEDYLALVDEVAEFDAPTAVMFLASEKEVEAQLSIEAELELGDETEWGKDGYARGLVDAWADRLEQRYIDDPDDPEVVHVLKEMGRFNDEVARRLDPVVADIRKGFEDLPLERLHELMVDSVLERRLTGAWLDEYERCRVWLGTRFPDDHASYYFEDREQVDHLHAEVRTRLLAVLDAISVGPTEGKGSRVSRRSLRSAATPDTPEPQPSPDGAPQPTSSPTS